jgi:hypothetical protein
MFNKSFFPLAARAMMGALVVCGLTATRVSAQTGAKPALDPLTTVNNEFRQRYARARAEALAKTGPIIVVHEGEKLVLLRNGTRIEASFVPATDMVLKSVAHVPLGVFVTFRGFADSRIDESFIAELLQYRRQISTAAASLESRGLSQPVLERQRRILSESVCFIDQAIALRTASTARLRDFTRTMGPLVLENIGDAARAQVDGLHVLVSEWRRGMTADEWASVHVVVIGVHMARDGELATQYFLRLLGEGEEGRRVVYAEGLWEEPRALDLLGTHVLDGNAGVAFFGNYMRMHRDVLADAARAYLDVLQVEPH